MPKAYYEETGGKVKFRRSMHTLASMVERNVRNQYRNSVLGILWTVLNPLLNMAVIALVFSLIFNRDRMDGLYYPVYILSGNIVFGLMRNATTSALPCLVNHHDLLTKTRLVHEIFPIASVLSAVVNFLFSLLALLVVMAFSVGKPGVGFRWSLLLTAVPFLPLLTLFSLGVSFVLASVYVRFRDVQHLYSVFLTLWTYLTPLFYSFEMLKEHRTATAILRINPMYRFVTYFREILTGHVPSMRSHGILLAWGVGACLVGAAFFRASHKKFLLYL